MGFGVVVGLAESWEKELVLGDVLIDAFVEVFSFRQARGFGVVALTEAWDKEPVMLFACFLSWTSSWLWCRVVWRWTRSWLWCCCGGGVLRRVGVGRSVCSCISRGFWR